MRIILLGTGTPMPDPKYAGTSCLIEVGGHALLFDCGPGATVRAVAAGFKPTQIDYLFFTHHHFDHDLDYPHLVLTRWDQGAGKIRDLRVYGPPPTERMTRLLFEEGGVYDADLRARTLSPLSTVLHVARGGTLPRLRPVVIAQDVSPGVVCSTAGWLVRCAPARHSEHLISLAYRVESDEGTVVIAGDTEPCRGVVELARGADLLIHMCVLEPHATVGGVARAEEAGAVARDAEVKALALVHMGAAADEPGTAERLARDAGRVFRGRVIVGRDLLEVP
ncbi:MAG: MBL fold metallo-hydrolase [Armatimonadetes bacterium]|nr:MBL fold metallo-hydrolase [Armatimonadota bacterium]